MINFNIKIGKIKQFFTETDIYKQIILYHFIFRQYQSINFFGSSLASLSLFLAW
jgi:hypothetical protein